ncbi:uncharacterized protein BDR25DRAFT_297756 [Lindgomyces ingoldianus]|uniref:Uncharacterized protein n=1 Tax=Lindgomyces ingoldianus TaxID=673940 RepID=A0ACB6Q9J3_9PLEO|nr:uncharacterized protein BDR25DRAFT_297756 [Lindgomyces ingoldianus]KAF2463638.1 hypothetical protein BDR25DRAFT_297756 [Lindgomyces ingoldianus]
MSGFNFGNPNPNPEKRTGTLFGSTIGPPGGLFAQSQQNAASQPAPSLFSSTAAPQAGAGQFPMSQQNPGLFGASQQQQQQQQQHHMSNNSIFGGKLQPAPMLPTLQQQQLQQQQQGLPQLRQSSASPWPNTSISGHREKSVQDQITTLFTKWNPASQDCAFGHYFYNQVKPDEAPFYGPQQFEDEKKWEEALSKKPSPGSIPVLARGFEEIAARIQMQHLAVNGLQSRLHEINSSLSLMKDMHELNVASRITEAKRKHIVFTQRTLALATKVQLLRNRGYVMDQAEEELKKKLIDLEKKTFDPVLGGRQEEIWARMSGVRERARMLQEETEKLGKTVDSQQNGEVLSEEDQKALEKLLKDYDKQLEHLKKWVDDTKQEYDEWEKEKKPTNIGR